MYLEACNEGTKLMSEVMTTINNERLGWLVKISEFIL